MIEGGFLQSHSQFLDLILEMISLAPHGSLGAVTYP